MQKMFETTTINGMVLRNRFVRSATWEGMALADGAPSPALIDLMAGLAKGSVGLIIASHAFVARQGQATPLQLGIHCDKLIGPLRDMVAAVHHHGGTVVAQLAHGGRFAPESLTGMAPLALSLKNGSRARSFQIAGTDDLLGISDDFAAAAGRARAAGFDGVQVHAAHGYLLSQTLSPALNQRSDHYGGTLENRARLLLEVVSKVRRNVGRDYPLLVKLNSADFLENGLVVEESLQVGRWLRAAGVDAIEVSGGTVVSGDSSPVRTRINTKEREAYFRDAARSFKAALDIPILLVGGMRSIDLAESLFDDGVADYFSMSRPLIREPDLIKRWQAGDHRKARCLSDNLCHGAAMVGKGLYCVVDRRKHASPQDKI